MLSRTKLYSYGLKLDQDEKSKTEHHHHHTFYRLGIMPNGVHPQAHISVNICLINVI